MKNIKLKRNKKHKASSAGRITNETIAEHRERILAGGRKFKYPIQYTKHKLIINTMIISVASVILLLVGGWFLMYPMQNTSAIAYRITRIAMLPVGNVDGEPVRYSDYLVQYRASEYYLNKYGEVKVNSKDWYVQLDDIKYRSMNLAQQAAYARKLARTYNITVSRKDVNDFIGQERTTVNGRVSQETYDASIRMLYGESADDYRLIVENGLLKNKVSFAMDNLAKQQADRALALLKTNGDFAKTIGLINKKSSDNSKVSAGNSGSVNVSSKFNGLRVSDVSKIPVGGLSNIIKSTNDDGYYIAKVVAKTEKKITFEYIHIPLTAFKEQFEKLKKDGKVSEYISIPKNNQSSVVTGQ
jgi:hypothetical protein cdiviTM7_03053